MPTDEGQWWYWGYIGNIPFVFRAFCVYHSVLDQRATDVTTWYMAQLPAAGLDPGMCDLMYRRLGEYALLSWPRVPDRNTPW